MKVLRKYAPFAAIVMCLSLLFVSCSPVAGPRANVDAQYSGEEIFQGLFFFQNDIAANISQLDQVAQKINEVRAQDADVDEYLNGLATMTTEHIKAQYPTFFDDLQATMYSGDYYQIQEKLSQSGKLIEQAILTSDEYATIYAVGKEIGENEELLGKIQALDLTKEADQKQLEKLLATVDGMQDVDSKAIGIAAVVAGVYLLAGAINTVVAAYYVIAAAAVLVEVAFWGLSEDESTPLQDELLVTEVSNFFSQGE